MRLFKNFKTRKQLKKEIETLEFLLTNRDTTINSYEKYLELHANTNIRNVIRLKANHSIVDLYSLTDKEYVIEEIHNELYTKLFESVKDYITITENRNIGLYGETIEYIAELDVIKNKED